MAGLGSAAARGATVTMAGQVGRIGIHVVSLVVLSRLLAPSDFGLVAMVVAVVGIGEVLRDFGLSHAAIQAPKLTRPQRDNLFWANTAFGLVMALVAAAIAPLLAQLYSDDRVSTIAIVLSLTFVINGLAAQYRADLNRSMRFVALMVLELTASALGVAVAIVGALAGFGYWALVAQLVTVPTAALLISAALCRWIPRLPQRHVGTKHYLTFGTNLVGTQLLAYVTQNVDRVVIGASFGSTATGLYNRGFELLMAPLRQVQAPSTRVALPVLSRLQSEPERFNAFLLRGQVVLLGLISALFALAAAQAEPLVIWSLGPQWPEVVPIFQILCLAGLGQAAHYATYWAFLAKGLTKSMLRYALVARPLGAVIIASGALFGVHGVAAAFSISTITTWLIGLWWVGRASPDLPVRHMLMNALRIISVYMVCGAASWWASQAHGEPVSVAAVAIGTAAFLGGVAVFALIWPAFRRDLLQLLSFPKLLRSR